VKLLAALVMLVLLAGTARAERLVTTLSSQDIEITSSFDGATLTMFGSIEPDRGAGRDTVAGPFNVVIVVEGPLADRVARQKTNQFGIWINTDQVIFERFPSFFHVLASGRLRDITDPVTLTAENILPEVQARHSAVAGWWKSVVFGRELVRLMSVRGLFGVNEQAVQFLSDTTYIARLNLPSDIANGPFITHTYLFKGGMVVARSSEGFSVRKTGFERFLGLAAIQQPLLYGIVCVILAIGTGWLGGVVFRR